MKTICLAFFALLISSNSLLAGGPFNAGMQEKLPPQEYSALVDLYNSTGGAGWTNHTDWLNGDATNWFGVTVAGEQYDDNGNLIATGNVLDIRLGSNALTGAIPLTLGDLTDLLVLDLYANQLSSAIPSTLGNLTNLVDLQLQGNQLSGAIPSTLYNLTKLEYLFLGNNQLSGEILSTLGNLTNLVNLQLGENQLSGALPSTLGNLTNLTFLDLEGNQLSGAIPSTLGDLTNLEYLLLAGNQLSGAIPSTLGNLTNLVNLALDSNQLSGAIPSTLGNLTNLDFLALSSNQLSGAIPSTLGNLTNLTILYLSANQLSGAIPSAFGDLAKLNYLALEDNYFSFYPNSPSALVVEQLIAAGIPVIGGDDLSQRHDGILITEVDHMVYLPLQTVSRTIAVENISNVPITGTIATDFPDAGFSEQELTVILQSGASQTFTFDAGNSLSNPIFEHLNDYFASIFFEGSNNPVLDLALDNLVAVNVTDEHGAAFDGATVELLNGLGESITTVISQSGVPTTLIAVMEDGVYFARTSAPGYITQTTVPVPVNILETFSVTFNLQPVEDTGIQLLSGMNVTGRTGDSFSYQAIATGISSDATITALNLPQGLNFDPTTGIISGKPTTDSSTAVTLNIQEGSESSTFTLQLTFTSDPAYPVITSPSSASLMPGQSFSYTITAPNSADPTTDPTVFNITGDLPNGLSFDQTTGTISGTYTEEAKKAEEGPTNSGASQPPGAILGNVNLFATNSHGTGTKTLVFLQAVPQLLNISTRMQVLTGDNVMIGGFIITGNAPKKVILRAIGHALASFGLSNVLADPVLELHEPDTTVVTNDNWKDTQQTEIEATGLQPSDDKESAIVATLAPGAYTAIMSGKDGGTGIGLVEAYDLDAAADSTLANISTRGFVDTGDNVMIGGVIIGGATSQVLVRAIGPELTALGVNGALEDTTLELHTANGDLITSNDDWKETQQSGIEATNLAPTDDRESAILMTLAPDSYTAVVRGKAGTTGVALVEVYNVSP